MSGDCKIEVSLSETELFIRINGMPHLRLSRAEYIGFQSWMQNRGRDTMKYEIEFYTRSGVAVKTEYDDCARWAEILRQLDATPILKDWD